MKLLGLFSRIDASYDFISLEKHWKMTKTYIFPLLVDANMLYFSFSLCHGGKEIKSISLCQSGEASKFPDLNGRNTYEF